MADLEQNNRMLQAALTAMHQEVPVLFDAQWPEVAAQYERRNAEVQFASDPRARALALASVAEILQGNPAARKRLAAELEKERSLRQPLERYLSGFASSETLSASDVERAVTKILAGLRADAVEPEISTERVIHLSQAGQGTARTVKLSNLRYRLHSTLELLSEAVLTGAEVLREAHPLMIAAGVVLLLVRLKGAVSLTVTDAEASILWGVFLAGGVDGFAAETDIEARANEVRRNASLPPLTQAQLGSGLENLRQIGCLETRPGVTGDWRLREQIDFTEGE